MKLLLKLAWRNVWRNKRRTILTLAAITFATFASVGMRGIQIGTYDVNITNAVEMFTGYLQIQKEGYQKNPSLSLSFKLTDELKSLLNDNENIVAYAPRVYGNGLVSYGDKSYGSALFGIVPRLESKTSKIMDKINAGRFFTSDTSAEIVVGYKLLENLNAEIGDDIVILSQGYDGSLGNLKFKITGSIKTGSDELDRMAAFIGLQQAQDLLALYGHKISVIAINLTDLSEVDNVKNYLNAGFTGEEFTALTWDEVVPDFKQSIELDNISGIMMLFILILIVAFGVLNTVLMSVTERFNEFGIILSIGMPQMKLVYTVLIETIFIAIIGVLLGNVIGWGINAYIVENPIYFGGDLAAMYQEYGFLPIIKSSLKPGIFFNTSISILVISVIACFYPLYKVYKLEPLKGIRYT